MAAKFTLGIVENIVKNYAELLKREIGVKEVYLYGSYVNGNYSEDSDIDVAVVSDTFSGDLVEDTLLLMRLRRKIDNRISPRPFTSDAFAEDDPFVKEIKTKGIRVI
ncbi:putative nucleotidyltransferase [Caldicoprobacter guelmensis]|uniref:nucleotidyltransferase domain-containing protein n=1 Tax=Caldicoprobacter guelmensis TaxID=1170224 RepID=UPI001958F585|nr:nucleotidyltransferase domain-containing protein [Caldicoprobacter guelmensis]MBM7582724.1 putative nucleotidyltransferase [Caldicoprobacter guelmensis]